VKFAGERSKGDVRYEDGERQDRGEMQRIKAGQNTYCRRAQDCCCSIQAPDAGAVFENDSGTEKTDAGDDT